MVCEIVDACRVVAGVGEVSSLVCDGAELLEPVPDVVLARVGNWRPSSVLAALEVAVAAGAWTPNPPAAIRRGRDHWRTIRCLARAKLPVPATLAGADPETLAEQALHRLGLPVVVKQRRSRMGVGVIRCATYDHLQAVLDTLWRCGDELIVQRCCATSQSLRLLVAGTQVVAAARMQAQEGEWRSNAARGGRVLAHEPSAEQARLAIAAAGALGLGLCGVDLLPQSTGPVVCEVNPSPGFKHLEEATGVDVAGRLLDWVRVAAQED